MIQTDTCEVCQDGIYRDIEAVWDADRWYHMNPEFILIREIHIPRPAIRSIKDDDTTN